MAARTRKGTANAGWPDITRERLKGSMLVNRLMDHVLGDGSLLQPTQVTAALGLLKKILPDLSQVDATNQNINMEFVVGAQAVSREEWLRLHGNTEPETMQ